MSAFPAFSAEDLEFAIEEVASGDFVHYGRLEERSRANLGDQANIGFIVGERCVAVIDTGGSAQVGRRLRDALRQRTSLPVCYVILTHVHPDHVFGAAAFQQDRPVFVGHRNLPRALQQRGSFYLKTLQRDLADLAEGSTIVVPTLLVADQTRLDLGGRTLLVQAWPVAHTDNDITVLDERTQTLWASDLLFVQHTPVLDGSIVGFASVLERLQALPAVRAVPGHGRPDMPWPQILEPERRYLRVVLEGTRIALRAHRTIQDAVDTVGLSEQPNWVDFEQFHPRNVTAAFAELEWED
ncbi:MAG TPA: quinoprotein relay system zinc metallohydrolase 2 [Burkholderiales bacterium]|nr:quinoprotein relay system zinc metallohydrolase 2 [Burkholderiales bacterium]